MNTMPSANLITTTIFAFICATTTLHGQIVAGQYNDITTHKRVVTQLCGSNSNNNVSSHPSVELGICECQYEKDGNRFGVICTHKQLDDKLFAAATAAAAQIPEMTEILRLGWNDFESVPKFSSNKLTLFDVSNNRIENISAHQFEQLTVLIELDLSRNHIDTIDPEAFDALTSLKRLDLSYNRLKSLSVNVFGPMISLETLILSKNRALNATLNKSNIGLFTTLGVTPKLAMLELNDLNLQTINLENGTGLKEIYLRYNRFTTVPAALPHGLELLDLSGNHFIEIDKHFLPHANSLRELHLSQMFTLKIIRSHAFGNLVRLQALYLDGCRNLEHFFPDAFDCVTPINGSLFAAPFLDRINLRNAKLPIFNLGDAATTLQWERIDLHGNPLICDCQLKWIRQLPIDTFARCAQPAEFKDHLVTNIPKSKFVCRFWPNFVYVMLHAAMLLCILFVAAIPIWLLIVMLKPSRRVRLQKIGSSSPYAPITINTNRAEDYY